VLDSVAGHGDRTLEAARANVEQQVLASQVEIAYHWVRDGTLAMHWPIAFGDQTVRTWFRLNRGLDDRDEDEDGRPPAETFSFDVALDPPGLGPLRAHVACAARQLSVRFFVARPQTAAAIATELPALISALETGGFAGVSASVSLDEAQSRLEPLPPVGPPRGGSIVNLRA
jgi:hypothetical protein